MYSYAPNLPDNNVEHKIEELYAQANKSGLPKSRLAVCIHLANKSYAELSAISIYVGDE